MTAPVLAAHTWRNNAELIADCHRLGYLRFEWVTLDPTYGRGKWWKTWRPAFLVTHDKHTLDGVDFTDLPHDDGAFDAVAYDPPYVCTGGRKTTTMPDFHDRYGIGETAPKTPKALQALINAGLTECARVTRRSRTVRGEPDKEGGVILVKCQDYISSGGLWLGTHHTLTHALELGLRLIDRLEMVQKRPRPQPRNRWDGSEVRQVHARRNLSTLLVLKTPKAQR